MLLHLTAGCGPAECELAAFRFLSVLEQELSISVLAKEDGRFKGCLKSALIRIEEDMPSLNGTIQWICQSPFRKHHKRKNWFISINKIDEPKNCNYESGNGGIIFQTFYSGGRGGQHANKTETAVRAIHISTGLTSVSKDERSQHQNKKTAWIRLNELIRKNKENLSAEENSVLFMNNRTITRGNPIRVYEGMSFKRI